MKTLSKIKQLVKSADKDFRPGPHPRLLSTPHRCICYSTLRPSWSAAQIGLNVLAGVGQAGPLTLLVACVQFTAPHAFLSTATGLAFSARAIGGAFGSAVLNAIIHGRLSRRYPSALATAARGAGLLETDIPALLAAFDIESGGSGSGTLPDSVNPEVLAAVTAASRWEYTHAYRLAWASVIPFVVLAIGAVARLQGVRDLMTEKVEATVEHVVLQEDEEESEQSRKKGDGVSAART